MSLQKQPGNYTVYAGPGNKYIVKTITIHRVILYGITTKITETKTATSIFIGT